MMAHQHILGYSVPEEIEVVAVVLCWKVNDGVDGVLYVCVHVYVFTGYFATITD